MMTVLTVHGTPRKTCIVSDPLWMALQAATTPRTTAELAEACPDASWDSRHTALSRWVERGAVVRSGDRRPYRYVLRAEYRNRPNPDGRGPTVRDRMREATQQQRIWAAARVLRTFDVHTLCMAAAATRHATHQYINLLRRGGYVAIVTPHDRFQGRPATFKLLRNSGPKCPTTRRLDQRRTCIRLVDNNNGRTIDLAPGENISRQSPSRKSEQPTQAGGGVG